MVKIPRIYVDAVVVAEEGDHQQCFGHSFDASLTGTTQSPPDDTKADCMCTKKIIGRRAALELREDSVVNLGIGIPEYISRVANEEGIGDYMTLTVEAGPIGGVPQGGDHSLAQHSIQSAFWIRLISLIFMTVVESTWHF